MVYPQDMTRHHEESEEVHTVGLIVDNLIHLWSAFRKRGDLWAKNVGLSYNQWQLMEAAVKGPKTVPQLARRMGLARQTVQRTADQLVKKQLASYEKNPDHLRSPHLMISEKGKDALDHILVGMNKSRSHFVQAHGVKMDELRAAETVLRKLREFTDPKSPLGDTELYDPPILGRRRRTA
jgi:DNA-binding MarR family transcriptional regulator